MTKEQKLKANIAAANLMDGMQVVEDGVGAWCPLHNRHFDIFTNPADCLAVVKKLGVEKHVGFIPDMNGTWCVVAESTDGKKTVGRVRMYDKTYEEAVGAACLEIKGE